MEYKEYTNIDRVALGWPAGEWDNEPDKVQWPDADTGLPCLAVRNRRSGNWCGYVGVAEGHRAFGKEYDEVMNDDGQWPEVHGGLTFANRCQLGDDESRGICHMPAPGEPDHVWWLGFDCAHAWDHSPEDVKRSEEKGGIWAIGHDSAYRSLAYVKHQCKKLALQLSGD